jgi:hypothetical protein
MSDMMVCSIYDAQIFAEEPSVLAFGKMAASSTKKQSNFSFRRRAAELLSLQPVIGRAHYVMRWLATTVRLNDCRVMNCG